MTYRAQAGLANRRKENDITPLRDYSRLQIGRIIDRYPEHGLVDIALERGPILRRVPVLGNGASTTTGTSGLPQLRNSDRADAHEGPNFIYDEHLRSDRLDTFAVIGFADGYHNRPMVLNYLAPNSNQLSFSDPTLTVQRQLDDRHEVHWSDEGIDIRPPPYGAGAEDHPDELMWGNYQLIWADREKDYAVEYQGAGKRQTKQYQFSEKDFGNDHQTYISIGYHDKPRVFGDGNTSANYDNDVHAWKLSDLQKGDKDDASGNYPKGQKHARGIWINQRWRSRFGIDAFGNVELRAEGLDYDSTEYEEKNKSYGTLDIWSRLEARQWHKHQSTWVRMRPRFDGGGKETEKIAKRTGTQQQRVQRTWDVAVRKDTEFRVKDSFTLNLGDFDSQWSSGVGGEDPGKRWEDFTDKRDKPVLNKNFKQHVDDDDIWKGDDFQDSGNLTIDQKRGEKAQASGSQTANWTIEPTKAATDAEWHLTLVPSDGNVVENHVLIPGSTKDADLGLILEGSVVQAALTMHVDQTTGNVLIQLNKGSGSASVNLSVQGTTGLEYGVVNLSAVGANPCSINLDASTGVIGHFGTDLQFNHGHSDLI